MSVAPVPPAVELLLERENEIACLHQVLDRTLTGAGGSVIIDASAGLGKSQLLACTAQAAGERGMAVARAQGRRLERNLAFGVLLQLFEPMWEAASAEERQIWSRAGAAEAVMFLHGRPAAHNSPSPFALMRSFGNLATRVTGARPGREEPRGLVMLVDDAHLADHESIQFLAYLAARINRQPIALVCAAKRGEKPWMPALTEFAELAELLLSLQPLSVSAVTTLLHARVGKIDECVGPMLMQATGGNPLLLHEMIAALPTKPVAGVAPFESAPAAIQRWVAAQLDALDEHAARVARTVALFPEGIAAQQVTALTQLDLGTVVAAADQLVAARLFASGEPLQFVQPIVRIAAQALVPPLELAHAHARAAHMLCDSGAPTAAVAQHLLYAPPQRDDRFAEILRSAASEKLEQGATDEARAILRRALAEQPARELQVELLADLARTEDQLGLVTAAEQLGRARQLTIDLSRRAELALEQGRMLYGAGRYAEAAAVLDQELSAVPADNRHVIRELTATYVASAALVDDLRSHALEQRERMLDALVSPPTAAQRIAIAHTAIHDSLRGTPRGIVRQQADLAWGDGSLLDAESLRGLSWPLLSAALLFVDESERALEIANVVLGRADSEGDAVAVAAAHCTRAWAALDRGELHAAQQDVAAALGEQVDQAHGFIRSALAVSAALHLERGVPARAEQVLEGLGRQLLQAPARDPLVFELRARVRLAQHRPKEALDAALCAGEALSRAGATCLVAPVGWRSVAALAHLALGARDSAQALAREELDQARSTGVTTAVIRNLRLLGLATGGSQGLQLLTDAVELADQYHPRLEHVRALVAFGGALRRANRRSAAREPLRRALDLAQRGGSRILADAARNELLAAGGRPRRNLLSGPESLTPREQRVLNLAARGLTTRQMAEALFVTPKTIEFHLTRIYRKLDITSRSDLKAVFDESERRGSEVVL